MNPKIHYLLTRCDHTQLLGSEKAKAEEAQRDLELKNCKK